MAQKHGVIYTPNLKTNGYKCEIKCKQYYEILSRFGNNDFIYDDVRDIITKSDLMHHQLNSWFIKCGKGKEVAHTSHPKTNTSVWKLNPLCKEFVEKKLGVTVDISSQGIANAIQKGDVVG